MGARGELTFVVGRKYRHAISPSFQQAIEGDLEDIDQEAADPPT